MAVVPVLGVAGTWTPPVHRVNGSVTVKPSPGFAFEVALDVQQDSSGQVSGWVTTRILDISSHGIAAKGDIEQKAECMRVVGNTAYISTRITKTFDEKVGKVGDRAVFWVQDAGRGAVDVAYGGPAFVWDPANAICTSTPPRLPATAVSDGDISVR
jgi:hypothetical protein